MPEFECRTCHKIISYGIGDKSYIEKQLAIEYNRKQLNPEDKSMLFPFVMKNTMSFHQWLFNQTKGECESCYSIIAKDNYPKNITADIGSCQKIYTVFSDMGTSVGDLCMNQVIRDEYVRRNPNEDIIFLDEMVSLDEIRKYSPLKVFWANQFAGGQEWVPRDAFWFAVTNEATELGRQGHYARLPEQWKNGFNCLYEKSKNCTFDPVYNRYIVFHLRNQINIPKKSAAKNIKPHFMYSIFKLLQNRFKAGAFDSVVLVGNDSLEGGFDINTIEGIIDDSLPIIDLRNKWNGDESLQKIAAICNSNNAIVTIGRDSGIVQLAAAAGCQKIVSWDYVTPGWFPKVPDGVLSAWVEKESKLDVVLDTVRGVIG